MVIEGQFGADALRQCDALFRRIGIVIEPVAGEPLLFKGRDLEKTDILSAL